MNSLKKGFRLRTWMEKALWRPIGTRYMMSNICKFEDQKELSPGFLYNFEWHNQKTLLLMVYHFFY